MSRWHPVDDSAALKEARKLMRKGLPAAAAARAVAEKAGAPTRANTLRAKLSREGGRRSITLTFSAQEWAAIEDAADGRPTNFIRRAIAAGVLAAAPAREVVEERP